MVRSLPRGLEELLAGVEKPARYIGGEWNCVVKEGPEVEVRLCLAFPDAYEIGMSHLGYRILYALLNALPWLAAERAFTPWPDMERGLRERGMPLASLETHRPLRDFDAVGFSLQHELSYTNLLTVLDLGGIPLRSAARGEDDPIVIAGGPLSLHPEPVAPFLDCVLLGDGEELAVELLERLRELKREGAPREARLRELARIEGVYVPALYPAEARGNGLVVPGPPDDPEIPYPVRRRFVDDLDRFPFPDRVVVPFMETVHERATIEIMRGCNVGCRFCQAGYTYRPERYRSPSQVQVSAEGSLRRTGWDELSLTSLNSGEYPQIEPLMMRLMETLPQRNVGLSLSSLRANSLTDSMAQEIARVRRTGLTMAPEAGSQRMRDIINKGITEEEIFRGAEVAFRNGWDLIKLYFMVGLPMETDEDVEAIGRLGLRLREMGRELRGSRVRVNLSASNFIPKPWTPFQWCGMESREELARKQKLIAAIVRGTPVRFKGHFIEESRLEAVLTRGDRRLAGVVERAWRDGCRLDGWGEHFAFRKWRAAFEAEGIDPDALAGRRLETDEPLPWDHLDCLVSKEFLRSEYEKSLKGETAPTCGTPNCYGCGSFAKSCTSGQVSNRAGVADDLIRIEGGKGNAPAGANGGVDAATRLFGYRATFRKAGILRFTGHRDTQRVMAQAFRRAGLPVAYSQGFTPRPKISFGPALALGFEAREEPFEFLLTEEVAPEEALRRVNECLPEGIGVNGVRRLEEGEPKLSAATRVALWAADLLRADPDGPPDPAALEGAVERFLASDSVRHHRTRGKKARWVDIRPPVLDLRLSPDFHTLLLTMRVGDGPSARPEEVLESLLGRAPVPGTPVVRLGLRPEADETLARLADIHMRGAAEDHVQRDLR